MSAKFRRGQRILIAVSSFCINNGGGFDVYWRTVSTVGRKYVHLKEKDYVFDKETRILYKTVGWPSTYTIPPKGVGGAFTSVAEFTAVMTRNDAFMQAWRAVDEARKNSCWATFNIPVERSAEIAACVGVQITPAEITIPAYIYITGPGEGRK